VSIERSETKVPKGKGKRMAIENTTKVTCDGCGTSRSITYVEGKAVGPYEVPYWYRIDLGFQAARFGQPSMLRGGGGALLDACSPDCVTKALAKVPVPAIDRDDPAP
jgi:hypothetical protein